MSDNGGFPSGKVVFLGVEGSGKSSLTVALTNYLRKKEKFGWSLRPENKEAYTFSARVAKRFEKGEMPAQTAQFRHLRWSLCYQHNAQRILDVLDFPGEVYRLAFLDPDDDPNPKSLRTKQQAHAAEIKALMNYLRNADQVFVLFNIDDAKNLETKDENIDAVWVTVQTMKVLSRLGTHPEITLLITKADQLKKSGESTMDADELIWKYVPIINQHFSRVTKLLVSSVDAENKHYGLRPLIELLLKKTALYQIAAPQWKKLKRDMQENISSIIDYGQLSYAAKAFSWIFDDAGGFTDDNEEWRRYRGAKNACGTKASAKDLKLMLDSAVYESEKAVIRKRLGEIEGGRRALIILCVSIVVVLCVLLIVGDMFAW